ncbi:MAG: ribosome silencing factor [Candidatus Acidiferrales bacterium]
MKLESLAPEIRRVVEAAQNKQASDLLVLAIGKLGAFVEYFVLASGESVRQVAAIAEEIEDQLARHGRPALHREGRAGAEWILLDYGSFIVHIFSRAARAYYDLERLWRSAERLELAAPHAPGSARANP